MVLLVIFLVVINSLVVEGNNPNPLTDYNIICNVDYFNATWLLDSEFDGHLNIPLRNETCNTFLNDSTHLWVTARYDECGTNITETNDAITNDVR